MNKLLKLMSYILVATLASAATFAVMAFEPRNGYDKLDELRSLIDEKFVGDFDWKTAEDAAAAGLIEGIGDRWSYYMSAERYETYLEQMNNSYVGVGITVTEREDRYLEIMEVMKGSPAEGAGLEAGGVVIRVGEQDISEIGISGATGLIKGEEGTDVTLTVRYGEEEREYTMTRALFHVTVASGQMLTDGIGMVTIENFDGRCAEETIAAIEALLDQGATKLIFDVRNNPGGYKTELCKVLDYLLPEGPLFRTEDYRGKEQVDTSDANCLEMPMTVIVNLHSYSAAEFFAAALHEYDAATVVGEKTYGKGYFQNTFALKDGSAVTLSIGKYYTPNGESLAGVGLMPDVEIPLTDEETAALVSGTLPIEQDPQIQGAVNAIKSRKAT